MDYETTLRIAQHGYPSLFPYEWDALNHFLLVLGNGYDWVGGELVSGPEYSSDPDEEIRLIQARHLAEAMRDLRDSRGPTRSWHEKEVRLARAPIEVQWAEEIASRREGGKRRLLPNGDVPAMAYPCGKTYGAVNRIPADVTVSWRGAIEKCADYIHSGHIRFDTDEAKNHVLERLQSAGKV